MMTNRDLPEETCSVISKIVKSYGNTRTFAYYDNDDITQEVWCMCLEALDNYDSSVAPLENFLRTHVSNRMKNLKRDKYFRPGSDIITSGLAKTKMNLVNALPLDYVTIDDNFTLLCNSRISFDPTNLLLNDELILYIKLRLDNDLQNAFDDLLGGNKIRNTIFRELRDVIAQILIEREENVSD